MITPIVSIAMTVQLPWAGAIRPDWKKIENRGRPIADKYIGRRVGIHAAATWSKAGAEDPRVRSWWWGPSWARRVPLQPTDFPYKFRKIIAVARINGCHEADRSGQGTCCEPWGDPYYVDPAKTAWHIVLEDIVPLADPVGPVRGSLAVPWTLPPDVAKQVSDRYLDAP